MFVFPVSSNTRERATRGKKPISAIEKSTGSSDDEYVPPSSNRKKSDSSAKQRTKTTTSSRDRTEESTNSTTSVQPSPPVKSESQAKVIKCLEYFFRIILIHIFYCSLEKTGNWNKSKNCLPEWKTTGNGRRIERHKRKDLERRTRLPVEKRRKNQSRRSQRMQQLSFQKHDLIELP